MKQRQSYNPRQSVQSSNLRHSEMLDQEDEYAGTDNIMTTLADNIMNVGYERGTVNSNIMATQSDFYSQRGTVISEAPSLRRTEDQRESVADLDNVSVANDGEGMLMDGSPEDEGCIGQFGGVNSQSTSPLKVNLLALQPNDNQDNQGDLASVR